MNKSEHVHPEYIRLPKPGHYCQYTGLSRSGMNELILPCQANDYRPPVKSFVHKTNKHNIRGIRLIVFHSLMDHLKAEAAEQSKRTDEELTGHLETEEEAQS